MVRYSAKYGIALVASGALAFSAPALAQTGPADAPPPADAVPPATAPSEATSAPQGNQAVEVDDRQIRSFAVALVEVDKIQRQYGPRLEAAGAAERPAIKQEANEKMTEVVVEQGLDPETFNAISMTAEEDPRLQARIREELGKIEPATPSAQ